MGHRPRKNPLNLGTEPDQGDRWRNPFSLLFPGNSAWVLIEITLGGLVCEGAPFRADPNQIIQTQSEPGPLQTGDETLREPQHV